MSMQCQSCHEKPESTCYCYDCKEKLCQNCYLAHQRVRLTKDHQVQFFSSVNSGNGMLAQAASKNPIQINSKPQNGNNSPGSNSTPPLDPAQSSSSSSASSVSSSSSSHKPIGNGLPSSLSNSPDNMLGLSALNQVPQALVPNGAAYGSGLNLLAGHDGLINTNGMGAFNHSFGNQTTELISNK